MLPDRDGRDAGQSCWKYFLTLPLPYQSHLGASPDLSHYRLYSDYRLAVSDCSSSRESRALELGHKISQDILEISIELILEFYFH